jgi:hypothetical protein
MESTVGEILVIFNKFWRIVKEITEDKLPTLAVIVKSPLVSLRSVNNEDPVVVVCERTPINENDGEIVTSVDVVISLLHKSWSFAVTVKIKFADGEREEDDKEITCKSEITSNSLVCDKRLLDSSSTDIEYFPDEEIEKPVNVQPEVSERSQFLEDMTEPD